MRSDAAGLKARHSASPSMTNGKPAGSSGASGRRTQESPAEVSADRVMEAAHVALSKHEKRLASNRDAARRLRARREAREQELLEEAARMSAKAAALEAAQGKNVSALIAEAVELAERVKVLEADRDARLVKLSQEVGRLKQENAALRGQSDSLLAELNHATKEVRILRKREASEAGRLEKEFEMGRWQEAFDLIYAQNQVLFKELMAIKEGPVAHLDDDVVEPRHLPAIRSQAAYAQRKRYGTEHLQGASQQIDGAPYSTVPQAIRRYASSLSVSQHRADYRGEAEHAPERSGRPSSPPPVYNASAAKYEPPAGGINGVTGYPYVRGRSYAGGGQPNPEADGPVRGYEPPGRGFVAAAQRSTAGHGAHDALPVDSGRRGYAGPGRRAQHSTAQQPVAVQPSASLLDDHRHRGYACSQAGPEPLGPAPNHCSGQPCYSEPAMHLHTVRAVHAGPQSMHAGPQSKAGAAADDSPRSYQGPAKRLKVDDEVASSPNEGPGRSKEATTSHSDRSQQDHEPADPAYLGGQEASHRAGSSPGSVG